MTRRYAVHYRDGWESVGTNADTPRLTALVALAYSRADSNGHAQFVRGELAKLLGVTKQAVQKLIDRAVRDKWLAGASCSECLVAPPHITDHRYVTKGPCRVHAMRE